jgi:hypothetical protein
MPTEAYVLLLYYVYHCTPHKHPKTAFKIAGFYYYFMISCEYHRQTQDTRTAYVVKKIDNDIIVKRG